jgi:diaminohydroxyphosphoribosylaminopyrimidine deaminase / 5-amino-6-(5-phosphoribosylamino)uracil reductase
MPTPDESFMRRALDLAIRGRGRVEPNPLVGCVIVVDGRVVAEGYHEQFGGPHAERVALADLASKGPTAEGATAYVTLEPCCHTNKKTPPCVPVLIEARFKRVVVGCLDPNPAVSGKGVAQLRGAGIDVASGVLEPECKQLNAPFFARVVHRRPYVTLKWAQSVNGKVAGSGGQRRQISNPASMRIVHQLRARSDAILVGIGTVLADDPLLTARDVDATRQPRRIVLDSLLRMPPSSRLVTTLDQGPVTVYCTERAEESRAEALRASGVEVVRLPSDEHHCPALTAMLAGLGGKSITHLVVDAGPTLAGAFFAKNLADRLWLFRSHTRIEDATAPAAAGVPDTFEKTVSMPLDHNVLTEYLNRSSPVFFTGLASPDYLMIRP